MRHASLRLMLKAETHAPGCLRSLPSRRRATNYLSYSLLIRICVRQFSPVAYCRHNSPPPACLRGWLRSASRYDTDMQTVLSEAGLLAKETGYRMELLEKAVPAYLLNKACPLPSDFQNNCKCILLAIMLLDPQVLPTSHALTVSPN